MKKLSLLGLGLGLLAGFSVTAGTAAAQSTLEQIKQRGHLRCQVGIPSPGFYVLDQNGNWSGSDVSICRAVATAIFGDPSKVEFQSVTSAVRFTALANGESDMLSRTATWTLFRDTQLGLKFANINFYDGQGFMVKKSLGLKSTKELKGATVCVLTGTTTELNMTDYSRTLGLDLKPIVFEDNNVRDQTYDQGGCDAVARFLGVEGELSKGLGLEKDWAYNIIKHVGNYGEVYEKYMGEGPGAIGIPRAGSQNALWTEGGLMYAPPFR